MKLSNKILITFASTLILIPLLGMIYVSQVNYKDGVDSYLDRAELNNESLKQYTAGKLAIPIAKPFHNVNLGNAQMFHSEIHLIKSDEYGVKIPDYMKNDISFNVDKNGTLSIILKQIDGQNRANSLPIIIYSPSVKNLSVNNARFLELAVTSDSLQVNVTNTETFTLSGAITYNDAKGKIYKTINQMEVSYLKLNLINSNFSSIGHSFEDLLINTKGKSKVEINGNEEDNTKYGIKRFNINTTDITFVDIKNIRIDKMSGSFSDQTTVQMPAANLNQMFKK